MVRKYGIAAALASCVLAGATFAGGGSAHAADTSCLGTYARVAIPGQTADWQIIQSIPPVEIFGQVVGAAAGPSNLWLFACSGVALHYQSAGWSAAPLPAGTPPQVTAATASSPSDVWAFATNTASQQSTRALLYNGSSWTLAGQLPGAVYDASAAGPDDVWASSGSAIWHYNGRAWTKVPAPFSPLTLSALPGDNAWVAGLQKTTPIVAHWTGGSWTVVSMSRFLTGLTNMFCAPVVASIYAQGPDNVWAAGGSGCQDNGGHLRAVLHWNGSSWSAVSYHGNAGQADSIVPDGSGGLWISTLSGWPGFGGMLHLTGGQLSSVAVPTLDGVTPSIALEASRSGGPVFGVGAYYATIKDTIVVGTAVIEQR
jgi:hypothetical protein